MLQYCPACWSQNMTTCLVFVAFTGRPNSLLATTDAPIFFYSMYASTHYINISRHHSYTTSLQEVYKYLHCNQRLTTVLYVHSCMEAMICCFCVAHFLIMKGYKFILPSEFQQSKTFFIFLCHDMLLPSCCRFCRASDCRRVLSDW